METGRETLGGRTAPGEDPRFYAALGRAIKVLRTDRGQSRRDLATSSSVSYPYLSEIENGKKRPSSRALLQIAEALEVPPSALLETAESYVGRIGDQSAAMPPPPSPSSTPPPPSDMVVSPGEAASELLPMPSTGAARSRQVLPAAMAAAAAPEPTRRWFRSQPPARRDHAELEPPASEEELEERTALFRELARLAEEMPEEDLMRLLDLARRLRR